LVQAQWRAINAVLWVLLAGVRPIVEGLQSYDVLQATQAMPSGREPGPGEIRRDLAAAKDRVFRKYPVNLMHQRKCLGIHHNRRVIDRRTADLEQLTLARQAQFYIIFTDHLAAFRRAHRFSPCDKLGGPWPLRGRVSPRTILHRELADLGMKLLDPAVLVLCLFNLVRKVPSLRHFHIHWFGLDTS